VVRVPTQAENFSLHYRDQNGSGAHPAFLFSGYQGLFPWGLSGQGVKLTIHRHLVPRSRMYSAITPLPQYAFMAWCLVKKNNIRNSSVSMVTRLRAGRLELDYPQGLGCFFRVQTGSGAHPASYATGTGGPFPPVKAAGRWTWPL